MMTFIAVASIVAVFFLSSYGCWRMLRILRARFGSSDVNEGIIIGTGIVSVIVAYLIFAYYLSGPSSFFGVELGACDPDLWKYETSQKIFQSENTSNFTFTPKTPLKGFENYQVMVDNDTRKVVAICAESVSENYFTQGFKKNGSEVMGILKETLGWLDLTFPHFISYGNRYPLKYDVDRFKVGCVNFIWWTPFKTSAHDVDVLLSKDGLMSAKIKLIIH